MTASRLATWQSVIHWHLGRSKIRKGRTLFTAFFLYLVYYSLEIDIFSQCDNERKAHQKQSSRPSTNVFRSSASNVDIALRDVQMLFKDETRGENLS